jgi:hypothetical protein
MGGQVPGISPEAEKKALFYQTSAIFAANAK